MYLWGVFSASLYINAELLKATKALFKKKTEVEEGESIYQTQVQGCSNPLFQMVTESTSAHLSPCPSLNCFSVIAVFGHTVLFGGIKRGRVCRYSVET